MKIVLAGGTGFIGRSLVKRLLEEGHEVTLLSRHAEAPATGLKTVLWDGRNAGGWVSELEAADAVVNLSGENIAGGRWTAARKKALRDSRLDSTRVLVSAISKAAQKPKALIQASAVGFYGDVPHGEVTENSLKGTGFLADLCAEWEAEAKKAEASGVRVALLRLGVVLEKGGGALEKILPPFYLFAGGPLGSGKQYFPWVHRGDVVGIILFALQKPLSGPYNVTSPGVLTMRQFCSELGRAVHRPSWAPVPSFVLRLLLGEMAGMLLTGQKAVPARLEQAGYRFYFPDTQTALSDILQK